MALGVIYRMEFYNYCEMACTVTISQEGFIGDETSVEGGPQPCVIKWMTDGDDKFVHIKASECIIQFVSTSSLQYLDLFTSPSKTYVVHVYRGVDLVWTGWLNPEYYSEPLMAPPYIVTINASDGVADLKGKPFPLPGYTSSDFKQSLIYYITTCIDQIGLSNSLLVGTSVNLMADTVTDGVIDERILESLYIDYRALREEEDVISCYDVLDKILATINARFFQNMGKWWIERVDQKYTDYNVESYYLDGSYGSTVSDNVVQTLTASTTKGSIIRFVNTPAMVEIQPVYKELTVYQDYGMRENILPCGNYQGAFYNDEFSNTSTLRRWSCYGGMTIAQEADFNAVRLEGFNSGTTIYTAYLTHTDPLDLVDEIGSDLSGFMTAWGNSDLILKLKFSVAVKKATLTDSLSIASYTRFIVDFSGTQYSIDEATAGESSDGTFVAGTGASIIVYPPFGEWKDIEITVRKPPDDEMKAQTSIKIYPILYRGWSNGDEGTEADGVMYANISVQVMLGNTLKNELNKPIPGVYDRTYVYDIDENNITTPPQYDMNFGDTLEPFTDGGFACGLINKCVLFDSGNIPVNLFGIPPPPPNPEQSLFYAIIGRTDLNNTYRTIQFKLRGKIIDTTKSAVNLGVDFRSVLKDYNDRFYLPIGLSYDVKEDTLDGEWLQFFSSGGEGGEFNDDFSQDFWI